MIVKMMHRTFEEWKKLDKPEFWSNNIDELRKANEDGFFVKRHEEYLANRVFDSSSTVSNIIEQNNNIALFLKGGIPFPRLLVLVGLCSHPSDARRVIKQGGARINGKKITDIKRMVSEKDAIVGEIKLSRGKKRKFRILTQDKVGG